MTITLDMGDAVLIAFLASLVWLLGYLTGEHDYEARKAKPRGLLDDAAFAAALDRVEREAETTENDYEVLRQYQTEHGFRAVTEREWGMREIEQVAAWAWRD